MRLPILAALLFAAPGCDPPNCPAGQARHYDVDTGEVTCVAAVGSTRCDPATTKEEGGVCVADPSKYPRCGDGTKLDEKTNTCVPTGGSDVLPPPCPVQAAGKFCLNGVIRHLKDNRVAKDEDVEVRVYRPLAFLQDPKGTMPEAKATVRTGTYAIPEIDIGKFAPPFNLVAVAVTDPGGTKWLLGAAGAKDLAGGTATRVDAFIVEKDTAAQWEKAAGLSGAVDSTGLYFARFVDKPLPDDSGAKPVDGVKLQINGADPDANTAFFFKSDLTMVGGSATDAATGALFWKVKPGLGNCSGKGGMIAGKAANWPTYNCASTAGVVFVQKFNPVP